jgi:hypothetical protein
VASTSIKRVGVDRLTVWRTFDIEKSVGVPRVEPENSFNQAALHKDHLVESEGLPQKCRIRPNSRDTAVVGGVRPTPAGSSAILNEPNTKFWEARKFAA